MTTLLIFIVLVLVAIAIWQLTKIFELSQLRTESSQIANDSDNKNNGYMLFAFMVFTYLITIFCFWKYNRGNKYSTLKTIIKAIPKKVIKLRPSTNENGRSPLPNTNGITDHMIPQNKI